MLGASVAASRSCVLLMAHGTDAGPTESPLALGGAAVRRRVAARGGAWWAISCICLSATPITDCVAPLPPARTIQSPRPRRLAVCPRRCLLLDEDAEVVFPPTLPYRRIPFALAFLHPAHTFVLRFHPALGLAGRVLLGFATRFLALVRAVSIPDCRWGQRSARPDSPWGGLVLPLDF